MSQKSPQCPFVYANGARCSGHITGLQAYGPRRDGEVTEVRKVRFWCSEKDNHAGACNTSEAKERMEFYPDQIPDDLRAWTFTELDRRAAA